MQPEDFATLVKLCGAPAVTDLAQGLVVSWQATVVATARPVRAGR